MKTLILVLTSVLLVGCLDQGSGSKPANVPAPIVAPPNVPGEDGEDLAPLPEVPAEELPENISAPLPEAESEEPTPGAAVSVLSNWGYIPYEMPMHFQSYQIGVRVRRLYYHDSDGLARQVGTLLEHRNSGGVYEMRACSDYLTINADGTLTIDSATRVWKRAGEGADVYCNANNGTYSYEITEDGELVLSKDGTELIFTRLE